MRAAVSGILGLSLSAAASAREMADANDTIELLDNSSYLRLYNAVGGEESINSSTFDLGEVYDIAIDQWTQVFPYESMFYLVFFGSIFLMIFIRQRRAGVPAVLGLIFGSYLLSYLPAEYYLPAVGLLLLAIAGISYMALKER